MHIDQHSDVAIGPCGLDVDSTEVVDLVTNLIPCEYWNTIGLTNFLTSKNDLFIIHVNIRSLQKNIEDLLHLITEFEIPPDVICVTETRLKISPSLRIDLPNYNFINEKTKTNAGGVGIYAIDDWNFTINCNFHFDCVSCENLWINLFSSHRGKYILRVIYRHPHNNGTMFLEKFEETLYAINQVSTNCCILGDINIDLLKPQDPLTIEYTNILHRNTLTSQISKPTRITNTSSTIIDHILINNCNVSVMSGILGVSNH